MGPVSPMAGVEPQLEELIIYMSRIQQCLTLTQCLLLANDLIADTTYEDTVIKFKENRNKIKCEKKELGKKYWLCFKKRWKYVLTFKRRQKFALDWSTDLTFLNMNKIYDEIYTAMDDCKVAKNDIVQYLRTDVDQLHLN